MRLPFATVLVFPVLVILFAVLAIAYPAVFALFTGLACLTVWAGTAFVVLIGKNKIRLY